jgi:multidrug efflux pump subunit AcrA (membrane-fusion protein)
MSLPAIIAPLAEAFSAIGSMGSGLSAALSVGTTAVGFMAQSAEANAQAAANEAANESARQQTISDYDQIAMRGKQEKAAADAKLFQTKIEQKKAVASAEASASEANIGGLSINALLTDIYGQEARIRDGVNQNLEATTNEIRNMGTSTARNFKNTINTRPAVNRPSLAGAFLEAGTGILGAYKDDLRTAARVNKK